MDIEREIREVFYKIKELNDGPAELGQSLARGLAESYLADDFMKTIEAYAEQINDEVGYDSGYEAGTDDGWSDGYQEGYEAGHGEGYDEGYAEGLLTGAESVT
jgi:flagellar biosynthesis/type III secretory pathway protein FliH